MNKLTNNWISLCTNPTYSLKLSFVCRFSLALSLFIKAGRKEKKEKGRLVCRGKVLREDKQEPDLGAKGNVQRLISS